MIFLRTLLISVVLLAAAQAKSATVVTSNYPLYYFASRISQGVDVAPIGQRVCSLDADAVEKLVMARRDGLGGSR